MSVISKVKDAVAEAKNSGDKSNYILVLEEALKKCESEIDRLNGQLSVYTRGTLAIDKDHLELFNFYRQNSGKCTLESMNNFADKSLDLQIALSELIDKGYFEKSDVFSLGSGEPIYLNMSEDKKKEMLIALKNYQQ